MGRVALLATVRHRAGARGRRPRAAICRRCPTSASPTAARTARRRRTKSAAASCSPATAARASRRPSYLKFMSHTCVGEPGHLLRHHGPRDLHVLGLRQRQPGDRRRLRGHPRGHAGRHDLRRRRGDALQPRRRVRHHVRDVAPLQRPARAHARARSTRTRDGLVVGEGAGTLVLESYERARRRGAHIYAEILGYGTNCDGTHVTNPSADGMAGAMQLALADAQLTPDRHRLRQRARHRRPRSATSPRARRRCQVLGEHVPVSSTKGFTGHTLGACGAIEAAFCIAMMREGWLAPNRTLDSVDDAAPLDYVRQRAARRQAAHRA